MDKLFELTSLNLIEMTKSFKLKSGKMASEISSSIDLKGKLFLYYKKLLNINKSECPEGIRCDINRTQKRFIISNVPNYLVFNLHKNQHNSALDTLNTFVLMPRLFDLGTIFDQTSKQKSFFEFMGVILMKPSKSYSACFKSQTTSQWTYYDDESIITFPSWYEFIYHCLKHSEYPIMVYYQLEEKYIDSGNDDLSNEDIQALEGYARNADTINLILQNKFRPPEDIIRFESENASNKGHSSKTSTSISTSKNNSNNNSHSRLDLGEYVCAYCFNKNRIESPLCFKCGKNNENVIEDLLKRRQMNNNNYINIANFNLNINTDDVTKVSIKPEIGNEKASSLNRKNLTNPFKKKEADSDDEEGNSKSNLIFNLDYNMPKQIQVKNTARESQTARLTEGVRSTSKKQMVTITSENVTSPEKPRISAPYCKNCHLQKCSCSSKKE
jgi:hypothetical protein